MEFPSETGEVESRTSRTLADLAGKPQGNNSMPVKWGGAEGKYASVLRVLRAWRVKNEPTFSVVVCRTRRSLPETATLEQAPDEVGRWNTLQMKLAAEGSLQRTAGNEPGA
jgi:hypothetical protein